jgi:hypothetical protein
MWLGGEHMCVSLFIGVSWSKIHIFCGAERFSIELISVRNAKQVAWVSERMQQQHRRLRAQFATNREVTCASTHDGLIILARGPSNNTHNEGFFRPSETSRATPVAPLRIIAGVLELHSARRRKH